MVGKSSQVTLAQAESKWNKCTKTYYNVNHSSLSGNSRKTFAYIEELGEVYGYRPNVSPVVTVTTISSASSKQPNSTQPNVYVLLYSSPKQTRPKYNFQTTLLMNEPPAIGIKYYSKC